MQEKLELFIKMVYKKWKAEKAGIKEQHPDEETLACFFEGKLASLECEAVKAHLIKCDTCVEALVIQAKLGMPDEKPVPEELLERVKNLVVNKLDDSPILEIILKFKEKAIEILEAAGDVLVGQELVPAPVLRSRKIKDFRDEVVIFKDFNNVRVELKIENNGDGFFSLSVTAKEKHTQKIIKDLRATLLKEDLEMESYLSDSGRITFERVLLGKYTIEISDIKHKLASILIDIKV